MASHTKKQYLVAATAAAIKSKKSKFLILPLNPSFKLVMTI